MKISDRHLTPEELVDIVDGTRDEVSAPHLTTCVSCREQLTELRSVMSAVSDVDVPEPSPLFWSQLSRRIGDAVAVEPVSRRPWWLEWTRPQILVPVAAAAVVVLILAVVSNRQTIRDQQVLQQSAAVASATGPASDRPGDPAQSDALDNGDDSLTLVADLTASLDMNGAVAAGLTSKGSAEHAVTHMTSEELRALERVLKEELTRSGA